MDNKFGKKIIVQVFNKSGGKCWYCGKTLTLESRSNGGGIHRNTPAEYFSDTYAVDHFLPRKLGGSDNLDNLVPACWSCNTMKRAYDIETFREVMTRLENNQPKFSDEQIYYLENNGLELPKYKSHIFWFETEGL